MTIRLERISQFPIFKANTQNYWEKAGCFNAAAIIKDDIVHLFYRATDKNSNGRECSDYMNYIGHAESYDGIRFTRDSSYLFGPKPDSQYIRGCEDPRVVKIEGTYFMLYTGYGARFPGDYRICMASSSDLINWKEHGTVLDESNKDASLLPNKINGEYILFHRRPPDIWISYSSDLRKWKKHKIIAGPLKDSSWEDCKIGIAGPPLRTEKGYILIYHGVSKEKRNFTGRGDYMKYSLGLMLLDLYDPSKVIYRQKEPILEPELDWELNGNVPNVVFSCGQVVMDGWLYVYYAGSDTAINVAKCPTNEIMKLF